MQCHHRRHLAMGPCPLPPTIVVPSAASNPFTAGCFRCCKRKSTYAPSFLSSDDYTKQHARDAIHRRAINSGPKYPFRLRSPTHNHCCAGGRLLFPFLSRLQFDADGHFSNEVDAVTTAANNERCALAVSIGSKGEEEPTVGSTKVEKGAYEDV